MQFFEHKMEPISEISLDKWNMQKLYEETQDKVMLSRED